MVSHKHERFGKRNASNCGGYFDMPALSTAEVPTLNIGKTPVCEAFTPPPIYV